MDNLKIEELRKAISERYWVREEKHQFIIPEKNVAVLEVLFITYSITYRKDIQFNNERFDMQYLRVPMLDIEEVWIKDWDLWDTVPIGSGYCLRKEQIEEQIFMSLDYPKLAIDTSMVETPSGKMLQPNGEFDAFRTFQQAEFIDRKFGPSLYVHWLEKKQENGRVRCQRSKNLPRL